MAKPSLGATASAEESLSGLRAAIDARLDAGGREWLDAADASPSALREAARLGDRALIAGFAAREGATLPGTWGEVPVGSWKVHEAARTWLLARAAEASAEPYDSLFLAYDGGDTETRRAALRALNFVRCCPPARGLELVLDAGRTYLDVLLLAAWSGNPFSAANLEAHDYRKAVLKAFFCEVPVAGFLGLEQRADATLAESMCEFMDERLAAGRKVPRELWPIAALHPRPGLVARMIGNLEHPDALERRAAAVGLGRSRDPRAASFLEERRPREPDTTVQAAISAALEQLNASR
ncbi:MAG: HEAT repeat domain-containing protein [Planctomycetes bacterium]|nr:HEAT repeat domain-containing protein [Planctomycetota bacterium]